MVTPPDKPRPLVTGLLCRCPRCGQGPFFQGLLTRRPACVVCGLDFSPLTAEDGPAFFLIVALSGVLIPLSIWVELTWAPALWVHIALWVPLTFVAAILLLRPLKAWFAARQYRYTVGDDADM